MVYEKLSDWGYLGTLEEIKEIQEKLEKIDLRLDEMSLIGAFLIVLLVVVIAGLPLAAMGLWWASLSWAILALLSSYFYAGKAGEDFEWYDSYKNLVKYPINKPRQLILKHQLEKLENRDQTIKLIQWLMKNVSWFPQTYNDLDSIEDDEALKSLAERLGMIKILMNRTYVGGKKYPYEFFVQEWVTIEVLRNMLDSLKAYDKIEMDKQIEWLVDIMTKGSVAEEHIQKVRAELLSVHQAKNDIILPSDIVVVTLPPDPNEAIKAFDAYIGTLKLNEETKNEYEELKDKVTISQNMKELHSFVKNISEAQDTRLDPFEAKLAIWEYVEWMKGMTEAQKQYFKSFAKLWVPNKNTAHEEKEVGMDLEKFLKDIRKPEKLLREDEESDQRSES